MSEHLRLNNIRRDRMFVRFDEFIADTLLNQIFKRATRRLLTVANSNRSSQLLSEVLIELADVSDVDITLNHFDELTIDRAVERFRPLVGFCRVLFENNTSTPAAGEINTFSLLFPMERVFEEFIGQFIHRHASQLNLNRRNIHLQAVSCGRWLLKTNESVGKFRLRPDIVVNGLNDVPCCIIDTKWKRLQPDHVDISNGVKQSDLYQLYAYAHRYDSPLNVLLYPRVDNITNKTYTLADDSSQRKLRVAFVDLGRDLFRDTSRLIEDLRAAIATTVPGEAGL